MIKTYTTLMIFILLSCCRPVENNQITIKSDWRFKQTLDLENGTYLHSFIDADSNIIHRVSIEEEIIIRIHNNDQTWILKDR